MKKLVLEKTNNSVIAPAFRVVDFFNNKDTFFIRI